MFAQKSLIATPPFLFAPRKTAQTSNTVNRNTIAAHDKLKNQPSLYQSPISNITTQDFFGFQEGLISATKSSIAPGIGFISAKTATITTTYNIQAQAYAQAISESQFRLYQSNYDFLARQYVNIQNPTTRQLRNYNDWAEVKSLVIRDELMKIQIGKKTDLPITDSQYAQLSKQLDGLDLSKMNDPYIDEIINQILHPDKQVYLDALKAFKDSGTTGSYFQSAKLQQLQEYLQHIDLHKITAEEFKYIEDNFIEKLEIHHRTSVSTDPTKQSTIDNLDTLNTTQHNAKHMDPDTGKINYRRRLSEKLLNRQEELKAMNRTRVLRENLSGLGLAVAIGLGTGFAIGFVITLAQNGLNPNSLKYAIATGAKQSVASTPISVSSYLMSRTISHIVNKPLTEMVTSFLGKNIAERTLERISLMCNMGLAGSLVIIAFSIYEFAKLASQGYSTKECLLRVGKSAALSFSVVIISMVAVWVGCPGIVVSIVAGVVITGYQVAKIHYQKRKYNHSLQN